jgi:hypothetical protein
LVLLLAERLIFNTTKVSVDIEPAYLRASTASSLNISVYPLNTLGFENPFGKADVRFEILEGGNLVDLSETTGRSVRVRSKGIEGEAIIGIYSLRSGVQISKVLVKIFPMDKT